MSTLVLARKYRPRSFTEMVGQEHVVQALTNALTQQRLHHAYLFTGTRGVGKTTVSRILAKSLNCSGADGAGTITASPCGVCPACRDIDAGRFVDYVELDAASNRGVDEISALLDQAVYKPVMGRFKVYMIDEVHMMTSHAFNAMLKTLEEPPDYLKFVLATTDPQKVPVTVLSRCLQFNLRPMAPDTIQEHLQVVLAAEVIDADAGALRLISRNARGSMRDALSLTDQAIAFGGGRLGEAEVRQMLGAVDRSHVQRIVRSIAATDGLGLVEVVDGLRRLGLSAAGTLEELGAVTQQMALLQAVPAAADANDPDTPMLRELAAALPADETQLLYSIALHGRAEIGLAPDEYSGLMMVLLRALAFRPAGAVQGAPVAGAGGQGGDAGRAMPASASPQVDRPAAPHRPAVAAAPLPLATAAAEPAAAQPLRSRELLRSPAVAMLSVTELPVPPVAAPAAVAVAQPDAASAPAAVAAAAPAPAALQRASAAATLSRAAPAPASPAGTLDEPDWLRDAEPPPDLEPDRPALSARESAAPPWDDEEPAVAAPVRPPAAAPRPARPAGSAATSLSPSVVLTGPAPAPATTVRASTQDPVRVDDRHPGTVAGHAAGTGPAGDSGPASPGPTPAQPAAPHDALTTRWLALVQPLLDAARLSGFVRELAWQSQCLACTGDDTPGAGLPVQLTLRVGRESLRQPPLRDRLQGQLAELLGRAVLIEIQAGVVQDSAALRDAAARARRQADAEALVHGHPRVQTLLARFPGAFVVPGSIRPL
ncbi:MAG: hypothetical protein RLZZ584_2949 [Pseudomonadota bacterium]